MDNFCSPQISLLDEGTSKMVTLLNEIATLREDSSNLQLALPTLVDPAMKSCQTENESALKDIETTLAEIAALDNSTDGYRATEVETAAQRVDNCCSDTNITCK